ncbi:MAG TPA: response regulator transcription factor, partial [Ramlibacter sp.]
MAGPSVLIIDSHAIVRFALETLVLGAPELRLLGSAATLAAGLALIRQRRPDLVLVDLALSDSRGLDTARAVVEAQRPRRTLVISMLDEMLYGEQVLAAGADGYIVKDRAPRDLVPAARQVAAGQRWISPQLNARLLDRLLQQGRAAAPHVPLTPRELDVLEQLKTGKSTREIAETLGISSRT